MERIGAIQEISFDILNNPRANPFAHPESMRQLALGIGNEIVPKFVEISDDIVQRKRVYRVDLAVVTADEALAVENENARLRAENHKLSIDLQETREEHADLVNKLDAEIMNRLAVEGQIDRLCADNHGQAEEIHELRGEVARLNEIKTFLEEANQRGGEVLDEQTEHIECLEAKLEEADQRTDALICAKRRIEDNNMRLRDAIGTAIGKLMDAEHLTDNWGKRADVSAMLEDISMRLADAL